MRLALPAKLTAILPPSIKQGLFNVRKQFWQLFPPRHLFVFGGRMPYWPGFGCALYAQEPVFRATVQECERVLVSLGGKSLLAYFEGSCDPAFLADEGRLVQFGVVVQLALVELWRAYGIEPDAVLGVSSGEPAAMYAAGGLSLPDALRVSMSWALISQVEAPLYGTLLLNAESSRARHLCASCPVGLFIIVDVDPTRQTLFCALADIEAAKLYLRAQGAAFHQIKTAPIWPYHTPVLIQHEAVLRQPLRGISPLPTTKPCYLATSGQVLPAGSLVPGEYWLRPPQVSVYQYGAIQAAIDDHYFVMTPVGAHPFSYIGQEALKKTIYKVRFMSPFIADEPELKTFATTYQRLRDVGLVSRQKMARG
jgi:acyl transferase domain-containing protein